MSTAVERQPDPANGFRSGGGRPLDQGAAHQQVGCGPADRRIDHIRTPMSMPGRPRSDGAGDFVQDMCFHYRDSTNRLGTASSAWPMRVAGRGAMSLTTRSDSAVGLGAELVSAVAHARPRLRRSRRPLWGVHCHQGPRASMPTTSSPPWRPRNPSTRCPTPPRSPSSITVRSRRTSCAPITSNPAGAGPPEHARDFLPRDRVTPRRAGRFRGSRETIAERPNKTLCARPGNPPSASGRLAACRGGADARWAAATQTQPPTRSTQ